jgi:hypothetical protein
LESSGETLGHACARHPSSGKSILAALLQEYVKEIQPDVNVIYMSWLPEETLQKRKVDIASPFNDVLNAHVPINSQSNDWLRRQKTLVLIDEAQLSYPYLVCGMTLSNVKVIRDGALLLSSFLHMDRQGRHPLNVCPVQSPATAVHREGAWFS